MAPNRMEPRPILCMITAASMIELGEVFRPRVPVNSVRQLDTYMQEHRLTGRNVTVNTAPDETGSPQQESPCASHQQG